MNTQEKENNGNKTLSGTQVFNKTVNFTRTELK